MKIALLACVGVCILFLGCRPEGEEQPTEPKPEPSPVYARILGISAVSHELVYAVGDSLWKSADGGDHWDRLAVPQALRLVKAFPDNHLWAAGDSAGLFHSMDGGESWINCTPENSRNTDALALDFSDAHSGWAVGRTWMAHTHDGGNLWQLCPALDTLEWTASVSALSDSQAWLVKNGLYHTTDAGVTWTESAPDSHVSGCKVVNFLSPLSGWVTSSISFIGTTNYLNVTDDGGITWTRHNLPYWILGVHKIIRTGELSGWIPAYGMYLGHTSDAGENWDIVTVPHPVPGQESTILVDEEFVDDAWGWAAVRVWLNGQVDKGFILHTTDAGATWVVQ